MSFLIREGHPGDAGQPVVYLRQLVDKPELYINLEGPWINQRFCLHV